MHTVTLTGAHAPRSPRIFRKRVRRAEPGVRPGEVVVVRTEQGEFVGRAFYSPKSVIALRILDREPDGPPVDERWFERRIRAAHDLRTGLLGLAEVTNAFRLVHAEGDGLGALVVDRYAGTAVVEVGSRGMFEHLDEIESALHRVAGVDRVVVRADSKVEQFEGFRALDRRAAPVTEEVEEYGLRFRVDCSAGHKTGFFCDQRENRRIVASLAPNRRVLDLCCYTGGFALAAAQGGARSVLGVDLDERAVALACENAKRNGLEASFEHADAFDVLRSAPRADLIVLDPPKLAATRRDLPRARRKSVDLNRLAIAAVAPGGLLFTFSCTGLFGADDLLAHVREASDGRSLRVLAATGQPPDHPVALDCPEGRYLSGFLLQVES